MVQASFPVQNIIIVNLQDKIKSKKLGIESTLFTVKKHQGKKGMLKEPVQTKMASQRSLHLSKHFPPVLSLLKGHVRDLKQENYMPEICPYNYILCI